MNILFLMADEFRHDAAGFGGGAPGLTPNLDRLAAGAVVFDNAYTPSPVCIPARQCLATGKYPLHIGCERFGEDIAPGSPTFARTFSEHGYYTACCGKLHHRGPDQMQGWMHRIGSETAVRWPGKAGREQIGRRKWRGAEDLKNAGAGLSPLAIHDDYTTRGACDFLRIHFGGMYALDPATPVLLMVSLQQPHFPLLTEKARLDRLHDRVPVYWNEPAAGNPWLDKGRLAGAEGVTEQDARRATAAYYGMVEQADERFGRVLETLAEVGQNIDDWLVVFTADHGDMLGEHGAWEKRKFYEGSARVPLFVRGPGLDPRRSSIPCNLVDLYPTLAALARLPAPGDLDGASLFDPRRPAETFCQYDRDQFMVRSEEWKYMVFPDGFEALFHLRGDPGELQNRAADPACAEIKTRLRESLAALRK